VTSWCQLSLSMLQHCSAVQHAVHAAYSAVHMAAAGSVPAQHFLTDSQQHAAAPMHVQLHALCCLPPAPSLQLQAAPECQ
jgi:hypothetical protein